MSLQCRPAISNSVRLISLSRETSITTAIPRPGGAGPPINTSPDVPAAPTYLGYLSKITQNILSQGAQVLGLSPSHEEKPTVVQSAAGGVPVKAQSKDRVIKKMESRAETVALVQRILEAESVSAVVFRLQQLNSHIINFPATRLVAAQDKRLISALIRFEKADIDVNVKAASRMCLTLCGYQPQLKNKGINLLCIDGGGTRGMMGLAVLSEIERLTNKRICELFDMVVGVSTGGIIATLLGIKQYSVAQARDIYMEISKKLFYQTRVHGAIGVLRSHSYYDTKMWITLLKELIGEHDTLIDSSKSKHVPRIAIVSSIVNLPKVEPYIFRNYEHPASLASHYRGGVSHELWRAIQASAAAPFYFEEVELSDAGILLQDGGIYSNNPSSIGVHEAKLLWPEESFHTVVSVGNGRSVMELAPTLTYKSTGLQEKLNRIIDSATDTEGVHNTLRDTLDHNCYFRLNPYMSIFFIQTKQKVHLGYPYSLDEIDPKRLEQMQHDASLYIRRNHAKIEAVAARLVEKATLMQEWRRKWSIFRDAHGLYRPK